MHGTLTAQPPLILYRKDLAAPLPFETSTIERYLIPRQRWRREDQHSSTAKALLDFPRERWSSRYVDEGATRSVVPAKISGHADSTWK